MNEQEEQNEESYYEPRKPSKKQSAVDLILKVIEKSGVIFLSDEFKESFAVADKDGATIMRVESAEFQQWLFNLIYEETGHVSNDSVIRNAIKIMEFKATANKYDLNVRMAMLGRTVWYDLGGSSFVKVDSDGWQISESPQPIIFKRFKHQQTQDQPVRGGNIDTFFDLINIKRDSEKLLLKVYLIAAFIPGFPHPILAPFGPQGSAKSTLSRLLKDLIDPSSLDTTSIQDDSDIKDFIQVVSHNWLIVLDNLSSVSDKVSDVLSRICTGGGLAKRILYSVDDDFIYRFQRLIIVNGINQIFKKPDLLDRSILLGLERIPKEKRMTEKELAERYQYMKPMILGAIFDAVSGALREIENVKIKDLPRMADFAYWGCAIARGLGYNEQDFISAYNLNIGRQNEEALEASPVATVIVKYMSNREEDVVLTPSELYAELDPLADQMSLKESKDWPNNANWLWRRINEVVPNLETAGIKAIKDDTSKERRIILQKIRGTVEQNVETMPPPSNSAGLAVKDDTDSRDSSFPPLGIYSDEGEG